MGPISCPKTLVRNYHYSLHNNPEECSSHLCDVFQFSHIKSKTPSFFKCDAMFSGKNSVLDEPAASPEDRGHRFFQLLIKFLRLHRWQPSVSKCHMYGKNCIK